MYTYRKHSYWSNTWVILPVFGSFLLAIRFFLEPTKYSTYSDGQVTFMKYLRCFTSVTGKRN
jgi:hypothetical protein